jgi:hypothetical protein
MIRPPFHEAGDASTCPRCRTHIINVYDDLLGFGYGLEPVDHRSTAPFWTHTPHGYRRTHAGMGSATHAVHHCPPPASCWWCGNTHINNSQETSA